MKTIKLSVEGGSWVADFIGDAHIKGIFGSTKLPTAFLASANAETVRATVAANNPGYAVSL